MESCAVGLYPIARNVCLDVGVIDVCTGNLSEGRENIAGCGVVRLPIVASCPLWPSGSTTDT
jgi:hypothetical protein